jgi:hypothetical protein
MSLLAQLDITILWTTIKILHTKASKVACASSGEQNAKFIYNHIQTTEFDEFVFNQLQLAVLDSNHYTRFH